MPDSKKILVTGTAGFIGFHLAERLIKEGYEVYGLDVINDITISIWSLRVSNNTVFPI